MPLLLRYSRNWYIRKPPGAIPVLTSHFSFRMGKWELGFPVLTSHFPVLTSQFPLLSSQFSFHSSLFLFLTLYFLTCFKILTSQFSLSISYFFYFFHSILTSHSCSADYGLLVNHIDSSIGIFAKISVILRR